MADKPLFIPDTINFLRRHFGVQFSFDNPELTEFTMKARDIKAVELLTVLSFYKKPIQVRLRYERARNLMVCVGGPFNGCRHTNGYVHGRRIFFRLERGEWAVYELGDDNKRAWFRGLATSQANARKMIFKKEGLGARDQGPGN